MSRMTIEDIARLTGVSRSTVSRVLNNHASVRPVVRDRVLQVINEQGYAPHAAARHLVNRRTHIIGVLFPRSAYYLLNNPIYASISQGIGQACTERGYMSMLSLGGRDMEGEALFNMVRGHHFDGVVLISSDLNDPLPLVLKEARIPYARIGHDPRADDLKWIDVDDKAAACMAIKHLISLGHRRIGCIQGPPWEGSTIARFAGYQQALLEAGLPFDPTLVAVGDWLHTSGHEAMQQFLQLDNPPTAVFSFNDMMAAGVLHALYEHGLTVPRDLALVGFDDLPQTSVIIPPLTTIRQPSVEMGTRAVHMVIDQLEGKDCQATHITLPATLVVRKSCGALH